MHFDSLFGVDLVFILFIPSSLLILYWIKCSMMGETYVLEFFSRSAVSGGCLLFSLSCFFVFLSPSSLFLGESSFIGLDTNRAEINNLALSEMKSCLLILCENWCLALKEVLHISRSQTSLWADYTPDQRNKQRNSNSEQPVG